MLKLITISSSFSTIAYRILFTVVFRPQINILKSHFSVVQSNFNQSVQNLNPSSILCTDSRELQWHKQLTSILSFLFCKHTANVILLDHDGNFIYVAAFFRQMILPLFVLSYLHCNSSSIYARALCRQREFSYSIEWLQVTFIDESPLSTVFEIFFVYASGFYFALHPTEPHKIMRSKSRWKTCRSPERHHLAFLVVFLSSASRDFCLNTRQHGTGSIS